MHRRAEAPTCEESLCGGNSVEYPLTEPCPQCGAEMEPRDRARRGRVIYVCPECGHEKEVTDGQREPLEEDDGLT